MKISIIRGAFLNPFELQNFYPLKRKHKLKAISSKFPISEKIDIPLTKLWSPTDIPNFPYKYSLLNRLFIDAHYLHGLEKEITGSDIAHVAETYYHYTLQAIAAKQKGLVKKVVSTCWEVIPHNNEGIHGRKQLKKLAYEFVDHFICPTELAMKVLIDEGVNPKKISKIRVGVDLSRFKPKSVKPHKKLNILFVGRLVEEKGVQELISAFKLVRQAGADASLTMIGNGPLRQYAIKNGAVIKNVPYEKIHNEYQQADVFCLPSKNTKTWQEQYGMALVEAMACGLPIITSGNGATKEVCESTALYAKSASEVFNTLEKLNNKNIHNKMKKQCLVRANKEFDAKKIANQLDKLYSSLF